MIHQFALLSKLLGIMCDKVNITTQQYKLLILVYARALYYTKGHTESQGSRK